MTDKVDVSVIEENVEDVVVDGFVDGFVGFEGLIGFSVGLGFTEAADVDPEIDGFPKDEDDVEVDADGDVEGFTVLCCCGLVVVFGVVGLAEDSMFTVVGLDDGLGFAELDKGLAVVGLGVVTILSVAIVPVGLFVIGR